MSITQVSSKIDAVKLYAAGATVTRIAPLTHLEGEAQRVEIAGLPLALDDASIRVRVAGESGEVAVATDVRIALTVPPREETAPFEQDEEIAAARYEVLRLEDLSGLIDKEIQAFYQLEVPDRPLVELGQAPPPSPLGARLSLATFTDFQVRARLGEKREVAAQLAQAKERLRELHELQRAASNARKAKPHELRKSAIVTVSAEGEQRSFPGQSLILEYFVPGARWTPSYVCRLDSVSNRAQIGVRAFICQRSGEDWKGVRLELSTAQPISWCELPQLNALKIGRSQPPPTTRAWRKPPTGADTLFEDYDRQKPQAQAGRSLPTLPRLPQLHPPAPLETSTQEDEVELELGDIELEALVEEMEFEDLEDFEELFESEQEEQIDRSLAMAPVLQTARKPPASHKRLAGREMQSQPAAPAKALRDRKTRDTVELAYGLMRLGDPSNRQTRGKLAIAPQKDIYLEQLQAANITVDFNVSAVVESAISQAKRCSSLPLPPGGVNLRTAAGSFDYAYAAQGRIDLPADGQFHSVALSSNSTDIHLQYVVVPREDTNVFRIAQLHNPLDAPLLAGPTDVYVNGEYILSTTIATVAPHGQMELGLGVEQGIKVARNTVYREMRSGETLVAFNELRHKIAIEIANNLPREAKIEVRERVPIPDENAKVDLQIDRVSPPWEPYSQQERNQPIKGGYCWQVAVPPREKMTLEANYTIKTFVDSELIGGNRRE